MLKLCLAMFGHKAADRASKPDVLYKAKLARLINATQKTGKSPMAKLAIASASHVLSCFAEGLRFDPAWD